MGLEGVAMNWRKWLRLSRLGVDGTLSYVAARRFIEHLARTELTQNELDNWRHGVELHYCPHCTVGERPVDEPYSHYSDCPVVEARRLLGMAVDRRGHLLEDIPPSFSARYYDAGPQGP